MISAGHSAPARQRGVALITALLIVALATTTAIAMTARQQIDIRRTGNTLESGQLRIYLQAVETWGLEILTEDLKKNAHDSLEDTWAYVPPPFDVEGGQVAGKIEDMQARFNLNNLVDAKGKKDKAAVERFDNLLSALALDSELADAIVDWIDSDGESTLPNGAEDGAYLAKTPAYRTPNTLMRHPSELRLINGITPEIYDKLRPFVTTLMKPTKINVNTAPAEVLMSLSEELTADQATELVQFREEEGVFETSADFVSAWNTATNSSIGNPEPGGFGTRSEFFRLRADGKLGRSRSRMSSLIFRPGKEEEAAVGSENADKVEDGDSADSSEVEAAQEAIDSEQDTEDPADENSGPAKDYGAMRILARGWDDK